MLTATEPLILIPEINVVQGLAVFLGGALAESVRQSSVGQKNLTY